MASRRGCTPPSSLPTAEDATPSPSRRVDIGERGEQLNTRRLIAILVVTVSLIGLFHFMSRVRPESDTKTQTLAVKGTPPSAPAASASVTAGSNIGGSQSEAGAGMEAVGGADAAQAGGAAKGALTPPPEPTPTPPATANVTRDPGVIPDHAGTPVLNGTGANVTAVPTPAPAAPDTAGEKQGGGGSP
eukprot:TRINITY_DN13141_c1_g1_i2.p1 TRINITY_DN13141_c1_g1~~TRINITY_DN13141_c1_g1_i2.p1  ORF type:complete len:188 (+),score=19.93 TRINITY_DN13141_c1_g1_i2:85-648(+)